MSPNLASLDEDLQAWTLTTRPTARSPGPSGHGPADASAAMVAAFGKAVSGLSTSLGGAPASWTWGRVHSRKFPAVTGANGLGYGPRAAGGDPFTEDAGDGGMTATAGPSWRMVATLGIRRGVCRGRVPGRAVGEPGLAVVREPDPALVGRPGTAAPGPGLPVSDDVKWTLHG